MLGVQDESRRFGTVPVSQRESSGPVGSGCGAGCGKFSGGARLGWAGRYAGDRQRGSGLHAPEAVNKLVFDLAVTPHCFSESDRFRYSFQTPDGTRYYLMDPVKKSKTPLWNNAKVAALSTLT